MHMTGYESFWENFVRVVHRKAAQVDLNVCPGKVDSRMLKLEEAVELGVTDVTSM